MKPRRNTPPLSTTATSAKYELVDACEEPCEFVDDRETLLPGVELDDIILHDSRCAC